MKEKDLSFKAFLKLIIKKIVKLPITLHDLMSAIDDPLDRGWIELTLWTILGMILTVSAMPFTQNRLILSLITVSGFAYGLLRLCYWMWVYVNT
ncbi:MAG: hypothetical protein DRO09_03610 [Thermoprotei archaeon]|nr:MAG: hypothetical protein DRO09_03610 [Thermoprotei archaeon]